MVVREIDGVTVVVTIDIPGPGPTGHVVYVVVIREIDGCGTPTYEVEVVVTVYGPPPETVRVVVVVVVEGIATPEMKEVLVEVIVE